VPGDRARVEHLVVLDELVVEQRDQGAAVTEPHETDLEHGRGCAHAPWAGVGSGSLARAGAAARRRVGPTRAAELGVVMGVSLLLR
jgi:hypothetical protein